MAARVFQTMVIQLFRLFRPWEPFRIQSMDRIAPRVVRIRLVPESGTVRPYRAGQFLFIRFGIPGAANRKFRISIANPPGAGFIEILVKGNSSRTLALYDLAEAFPESRESNPGQEDNRQGSPWMAWLDYPYGSFTTDGADTGPWVFLAAGIGISPFLAMASDKLRDDARVLILWAARTRDDLAGFEELAALNARRPSIRMIPVLGHDPLWSGRHGRLDRQTLEELASRELADPEARYWICCPAPLRKALVKALKNLGVPGKHIRCEVFSQ